MTFDAGLGDSAHHVDSLILLKRSHTHFISVFIGGIETWMHAHVSISHCISSDLTEPNGGMGKGEGVEGRLFPQHEVSTNLYPASMLQSPAHHRLIRAATP